MDEIIFKKYAVQCRCCGKIKNLVLKCEDVAEWRSDNPRHIQDVFPYLSADDRELILSGTCGECWKNIFPDI